MKEQPKDKSLIPIQTQLSKIGQQVAITERLLAQPERQRVRAFSRRHPDFFAEIVSRHYPLSETLIEKYKDKWDWGWLSNNTALPWSEMLIKKYIDRWRWEGVKQ